MQIGWWQLLIVVLLIVLLFGGNRLSTLMGDVAKGIKNFRQGMRDDDPPPPAKSDANPDGSKS